MQAAKVHSALLSVEPGAPWAITEDGLRDVIRHVSLSSADGQPLKQRQSVTMRGDVAVIAIAGPLTREESFWSYLFGSSTYEGIARDLEAAISSPEVKRIVLNVASPGGAVHGCSELSAMIYAARGVKPIEAYVGEQCCSAAYWIASAADRMYCDRVSMTGSIGVRTTLVDVSKMLERAGVEQFDIVSDQSPLKVVDPADAKDRQRVKDMCSAMAAVFVADVARNRGVPSSTVASSFGKGDVFIGAAAVKAGLVDGLSSFESLLASNDRGPITGARAMSVKPTAASINSEKCDGCATALNTSAKTYCAKCYEGPDDEDDEEEEAKSHILEITGSKSLPVAFATIQGWKEAAADAAQMKAEHAKAQKIAADAAFDALIVEASKPRGTEGPLLPGSDEHPRRKFAMSLRASGVEGLRGYLGALSPLVPGTPAQEPTPAAVGRNASGEIDPKSIALTAKEIQMGANMGATPDELRANKARRMALPAPTRNDVTEEA